MCPQIAQGKPYKFKHLRFLRYLENTVTRAFSFAGGETKKLFVNLPVFRVFVVKKLYGNNITCSG